MPQPIHKGPFVFCPKSGKFIGFTFSPKFKSTFKPKFFLLRWLLPLVGLAALVWYLLRVIPKPSRATYPCQQVAAPLALGFLASFTTAIIAFRKARHFVWQARYGLAAVCGIIAAVATVESIQLSNSSASGAWAPTDKPDAPIGVARGINPGRVVWVRDPSAVKWDGRSGHWWDPAATDQAKVDAMVAKSVVALTGAKDDAAAWTALFTYYNKTHGKGEAGYVKGQKILIKINQNTARDGHAGNGNNGNENSTNGNPHLILATLKQLVTKGGVAQDDIIVYDLSRFITDAIYVPCHKEFPNVHWVEVEKGGGDGREAVPQERDWIQNALTFSDPSRGLGRNLPKFITSASYMINMAVMKNHGDQGATLVFKNHFGTIHGLNHDAISPHRMGESNPLVDVMASKDVGEKTFLFMIDTLYGADGPDSTPSKWKMAPFKDSFPASLFVSQDGVAIESVGFDFVNTEWGCKPFTDNIMHEAALADAPPSGKKYGPVSLGVHEHWNNPTDMKYSRNLAPTGKGIELMPILMPAAGVGLR